MNNIINYFIAHWSDIITALGGIIIAARVIVKLTPTPKDDSALEAVVDFLKHLGLVIKDKSQVIISALCLLILTSCAGVVDVVGNFLGSPSGQIVMAAIVAQAKTLENTWEAKKIPPLIDKANAAISKLPAKTGNAIKDLPRDMQEKGWREFISLAQSRYKSLTGGKYVTPVTLIP